MDYSVLAHKMAKIADLKLHPKAAQIPMDGEDYQGLRSSIDENGVLTPLIVNEKGEVVDGNNRLRVAQELGIPEVPVVVVRIDDVNAFALESLTRRKGTTGQRVLARLLRDADGAATYWAAAQEVRRRPSLGFEEAAAKVKPGIKAKRIAELQERYAPEALAERLGASDKDVRLALELVACRELQLKPIRGDVGGEAKPLDLEKKGDKEIAAALDTTFSSVLAGSTPVRRWKAALGGAGTTKGKADTDYVDLARRATISLHSVFTKGWAKMSGADQDGLIGQLEELSKVLPERVLQALNSAHTA